MQNSPPSEFQLDPKAPRALEAWLRPRGWLGADEPIVRLASAGDGNMNMTLRVTTARRSFIVKQSRAYVEKYPHIPAPAERTLVEAAFYRTVASEAPIHEAMPELIGVDRDARLIVLEDLGAASDMMNVYRGVRINAVERAALLAWLSHLHAMPISDPDPLLENRAMRELNHGLIFDRPLRPTDLIDLDALTPGLASQAARIRKDPLYTDAVRLLGQRYLGTGTSLLHGEFYPGSWLRTAHGIRIIDPELCFVGPPEFDVGVMVAHAILAGDSPDDAFAAVDDGYDVPPGFDGALAGGFAGAEIMRRLIGVAQLPISASGPQKAEWLAVSRQLVAEFAVST